jgi:murein DD-endopeptidase MepM/ murein hydrolase activator NlpD
MREKHFTFLYVPNATAAPKTLKIPKLFVVIALAMLLLGASAAAFVAVKYSGKMQETFKLTALEKENEVLRGTIEEMDHELKQLSNQVSQNFNFQKKARLLANLDEIDSDVTEAGVGGPHFGYIRSLSILDDDARNNIQSLRTDIDHLSRQTKLQKESYDEIIASLSEKMEMLNSTPSIRPVPHGFISSRFGRRVDPFTGRLSRHQGVDYSVRLGAAIFATADGVVSYARRWSNFGNVVEISHGHGFVTRYAHVSKIMVKKGQRVKRGDIIARVGSSGRSTAAHLHYEVLREGTPQNPVAYILTDLEIVD